jgi:hypothetical protein
MYVWFITIVGATEAERKKRELQFDSDILMWNTNHILGLRICCASVM